MATTTPRPIAALDVPAEGALAEQRHCLDTTDDAFARMAAEHPEACHTDADYPAWVPGRTA